MPRNGCNAPSHFKGFENWLKVGGVAASPRTNSSGAAFGVFCEKRIVGGTMQTKHLALVRALPESVLPALRARALDPHTTENTRPFGVNPIGGHLYVGRRIRTLDGKRKWEIYGTPAGVLEILDFLEGEKKMANAAINTTTPNTEVFIPTTQPPINVTEPVAVVVTTTLPIPDQSIVQTRRGLTTTWMVGMVLLMLAPCSLYLANLLSRTVKTSEQSVTVVPSTRTNGAFDHPYHGQNIGVLTAKSGLVKTVKDTRAIDPNQTPGTITKTDRSTTRLSQSIADISRQMQALETQGSRMHRLSLFFEALELSAGVQARKLEFNDDLPLADGQIVEASGQKLFDQIGQMPATLPKPLRLVWESPRNSAVAAELRDSLMSCVTAVAIQPDLMDDQLVLRAQSQRLAAAFRAAYGVPESMASWRDPDSSWIYTIIGTCVVIHE